MSISKTTHIAIKPKHKVHIPGKEADIPLNGKKIHFVHVKQIHSPGEGVPTKPLYEKVIRSQLAVAKAIRARPECPILVEGLFTDAMPGKHLGAIHRLLQEKFPTGFRYEFNELSHSQKQLIYTHGAPRILYHLGEIPMAFKSIHQKTGVAIDLQVAAGMTDGMFRPREEEAVLCTKEAAAKVNASKFLVVFGAAHKFRPYCKREGFSYSSIDCRT